MIESVFLEELLAQAIKNAVDKEIDNLNQYKEWIKLQYEKLDKYEKERRYTYMCTYVQSFKKYIHVFKRELIMFGKYFIRENKFVNSFTIDILSEKKVHEKDNQSDDDGEFVHYNINTGEITPVNKDKVIKVDKVSKKDDSIPQAKDTVLQSESAKNKKEEFDIETFNKYKTHVVKQINDAASAGLDECDVGDYTIFPEKDKKCQYTVQIRNLLTTAGYITKDSIPGRYIISWITKK